MDIFKNKKTSEKSVLSYEDIYIFKKKLVSYFIAEDLENIKEK